jgi:hypothetical protein
MILMFVIFDYVSDRAALYKRYPVFWRDLRITQEKVEIDDEDTSTSAYEPVFTCHTPMKQ